MCERGDKRKVMANEFPISTGKAEARYGTYMHPIPTTRIDIALLVNLNTVSDAGINISKYTSVLECLGCRIHIELITVAMSEPKVRRSYMVQSYIVAGHVPLFPRKPPVSAVSVLHVEKRWIRTIGN